MVEIINQTIYPELRQVLRCLRHSNKFIQDMDTTWVHMDVCARACETWILIRFCKTLAQPTNASTNSNASWSRG